MKVTEIITISDPKTGIIEKTIRDHSLTKQFAQWLALIADKSGNSASIYDMKTNLIQVMGQDHYWGTASTTADGSIVTATGNSTAEGISNEDLDAIIIAGVGAGQLVHGNPVLITPYLSGADWRAEVQRTFTNNSGSDITVNEIGFTTKNGASSRQILLSRIVTTFIVAIHYRRQSHGE